MLRMISTAIKLYEYLNLKLREIKMLNDNSGMWSRGEQYTVYIVPFLSASPFFFNHKIIAEVMRAKHQAGRV